MTCFCAPPLRPNMAIGASLGTLCSYVTKPTTTTLGSASCKLICSGVDSGARQVAGAPEPLQ